MTLVFDPFLPYWALILACAIGVAFAAINIWRNWKSGLLRLAAVAALIALLFNPLLREAERAPLEDIAIVLIDRSASQTLDNRDDATTAALEKLSGTLEAFEDVELRIVEFSGEEETRTIEALQGALADAPRARLGGVFIITDGQASDAALAETLSGVDAPVHLMLTGRSNEVDRKITLTNAPRYGLVRQSVRVSFRIDDLGPNDKPLEEGGSATVTLRVDGEEILRENVPLGAEAGFDAPLSRPGSTIIELQVDPRPGELTTRNNTAVLPITAIRDRLRVLLVSGEPHPGERVWRNLLKSDPAVDLVHFTILRPTDKNDATPISELALIPFPDNELFIDKLGEFDLLIFDRYTYRNVIQSYHFDNIARFVEGGGAVLIAAGPEYNGVNSLAARRNLSFILPALPAGQAIERAYRPAVTDLGKRHPVTADLPEQEFWGRWLRLMPVAKLQGQTLMEGPGASPLLILDRVGEGRVGLLLSDHVWLWARGFDGGGPHAELLRRIAHWLMKEPELEEEALALRAEGDTLIIERRSIEDNPPAVSLERPDGTREDAALQPAGPGKFEARITDAPRGLYRAYSGDLFAIGAVGLAAPPEFEKVVSTNKRLKPIVEETSGGIFSVRRGDGASIPDIRRQRPGAGPKAGSGWAGLLERRAARIESVKDGPLAPSWAWLVFIGLALLLAWLVESGRSLGRKKQS